MSAPTTSESATRPHSKIGGTPNGTSPTALRSGLAGGLPTGPASERVGHRLRTLVTGVFSELRFVSQRPVSLLEHLAYARRGEWTEEIDGPRRHAVRVYAWLVAIPISTLAYLLAWAAARPGRFISFVAVTLLVCTALAQVPAVAWLIPDWMQL
jgi:hypothetical protein